MNTAPEVVTSAPSDAPQSEPVVLEKERPITLKPQTVEANLQTQLYHHTVREGDLVGLEVEGGPRALRLLAGDKVLTPKEGQTWADVLGPNGIRIPAQTYVTVIVKNESPEPKQATLTLRMANELEVVKPAAASGKGPTVGPASSVGGVGGAGPGRRSLPRNGGAPAGMRSGPVPPRSAPSMPRMTSPSARGTPVRTSGSPPVTSAPPQPSHPQSASSTSSEAAAKVAARRRRRDAGPVRRMVVEKPSTEPRHRQGRTPMSPANFRSSPVKPPPAVSHDDHESSTGAQGEASRELEVRINRHQLALLRSFVTKNTPVPPREISTLLTALRTPGPFTLPKGSGASLVTLSYDLRDALVRGLQKGNKLTPEERVEIAACLSPSRGNGRDDDRDNEHAGGGRVFEEGERSEEQKGESA